jgi:hypothetical protein
MIQTWTMLINHELAVAQPADSEHAVTDVRTREVVGEQADLVLAVL